MSNCPSVQFSGVKLSAVSNCLWCLIVRQHGRCQIVCSVKLSWCKIVLGPKQFLIKNGKAQKYRKTSQNFCSFKTTLSLNCFVKHGRKYHLEEWPKSIVNIWKRQKNFGDIQQRLSKFLAMFFKILQNILQRNQKWI